MKKRLLSALLALVMVCTLLPVAAWADTTTATEGSCGKNVTWTLSGGTLTISGTGEMEGYSYSTKPAWDTCRDQITAVVIEDGVTTVGSCAFRFCTNLRSVTIPGSVTHICDYAFYRCTGLTAVTVPEGVIHLGFGAFSECTGLCTVSLPDSLRNTGAEVFAGCTGLTAVRIPRRLTTIEESLFANCTKLQTVTVSEGVTAIGQFAFENCSALSALYLPVSLTKIDQGATSGALNINDVYYNGTQQQWKAIQIAEGNLNLTTHPTIHYSANTPGIPVMTLSKGSDGKPVISWTKAVNAAQYEVYRSTTGAAGSYKIIRRTTGLSYTDTSTAVGTTYYYVVRAINGSASSKFCAAQSIRCTAPVLGVPAMTLSLSDGKPVITWTKAANAAQYEVYRSTDGKTFSIIRRTSGLTYTDTSAAPRTTYYYKVRAINGSYSGSFCASASIRCPALLGTPQITLALDNSTGKPVVSWTKVDGATQYEVYHATDGKNFSIIYRTSGSRFTETNAVVGTHYSYKIRAIKGTGSSTVYGDFCDAKTIQCTGVAEAGGTCGDDLTWTLSDGTLIISGTGEMYEYGWINDGDDYVPAPWCTDELLDTIRKVVVNPGVTGIGKCAFAYCRNLTAVSLPNTLIYLDANVFYCCERLTSIVIPEGVEWVSGDLFFYCTSLRTVSLPSTLCNTGGCTFAGCTSLQSIVLPEGIRDITWRMFWGCTSLRSITIPGSVMSIGKDAFNGCTALTSVRFTGSRTDWDHMRISAGNNALRAATLTCTGSAALAAPTFTASTTVSGGMPYIRWNPVSGAASYEIWCSDVGGDLDDVRFSRWWIQKETSFTSDRSMIDGATYAFKVRAIDANGNLGAFSQSTEITFTPTLATPVLHTEVNKLGQPVISWDKVSGATQYEIHRWNDLADDWQILCRTSALTYTDTTAQGGTEYWYRLRAVNGSVSSAISYMEFCRCTAVELNVPAVTASLDSSRKPLLSWQKVDNATAYDVYRSTDGKSFSIVRRTSGLTYSDTNAAARTNYYYKVRAINGTAPDVVYGLFCDPVSFRCPAPLDTPSMMLGLNTITSVVDVRWSAVTGAAQYEVYRSDSGKAGTFRIVRRTTATSWQDTGAAAGKIYYYVVRAMKGSGTSAVYGDFCAARSVSIPALATPSMYLEQAADGCTVIGWSKVTGATQYEVYRSDTGAKGSFKIVRRTSAAYWKDTTAEAGHVYYYTVRAMKGSGTSAVYSSFCPSQKGYSLSTK